MDTAQRDSGQSISREREYRERPETPVRAVGSATRVTRARACDRVCVSISSVRGFCRILKSAT